MKYNELPPSIFKLVHFLKDSEQDKYYVKDIAKELNLSESHVRVQLKYLIKQGYISKEQEGGGQGKTPNNEQRKLIIKLLK